MQLSLPRLWQSWYRFRRGKRPSPEIDAFAYSLEANLQALYHDLISGTYVHGQYRRVTIQDNKRRDLAVAIVRDRVVHRLLYEFLVNTFDRKFIYDVWSCRRGKGLIGAIERAQSFMVRFQRGYVWRADITKFFDHVNHAKLKQYIRRRVVDRELLTLIDQVIDSYLIPNSIERVQGIPIGNLTSQIFSNIYLNELDRFVVHELKPLAYLRYGDDFTVFAPTKVATDGLRKKIVAFCRDELSLTINPKQDIIVPVRRGIYFLGVEIYPTGRRLRQRHWERIRTKLAPKNVASYGELINRHSQKMFRWYNWLVTEKILN